jgi:serine/threonine protein kinase
MWTITGTLYYRAPEIFEGGYQESVDVWAAGILLFRLAQGKTPFESEYQKDAIQNIKEAPVAFGPQFKKFSPELRSLVSKMLTRRIEDRPTSAECLGDSWFGELHLTPVSKRGHCLQDSTYHESEESNRGGLAMKQLLSLAPTFELDARWTATTEPLTPYVQPYLREVKGHTYLCIDSEWRQ